jgi:hypothetical protein
VSPFYSCCWVSMSGDVHTVEPFRLEAKEREGLGLPGQPSHAPGC